MSDDRGTDDAEGTDDPTDEGDSEEPTDDEVVEAAAEAAKDVIFSRFGRSEVYDYDVTVSFEDGVLEVDVYVDADGGPDSDRVAEDAALAARGAVDELF